MDEKKFKKKFNALLLMRDFTAAKKLLNDSDLPEARRQELSHLVDEEKKRFWRRFWRNFFEEDLYAVIPAVVIYVPALLVILAMMGRHILVCCILSAIVSIGMLWFYWKVIRPLWKRLRRPGGMAVFERDKKWMGRLLWWIVMAWSLLVTGIIFNMVIT